MAALEGIFEAPTDDEQERKRRDKLLRYAIVPLLDTVLNSFQQVQGRRSAPAGFGREARATAIC